MDKIKNENCLAMKKPDLIKEWHHEKNKSLTPWDITYGSTKKVWWKCKKGHEWESQVANRNHKTNPTGCPYCL